MIDEVVVVVVVSAMVEAGLELALAPVLTGLGLALALVPLAPTVRQGTSTDEVSATERTPSTGLGLRLDLETVLAREALEPCTDRQWRVSLIDRDELSSSSALSIALVSEEGEDSMMVWL